jgi:hypothetical protein
MALFDSTVPSSIGYTPSYSFTSSTPTTSTPTTSSSSGGFFSSGIGQQLATSGISSFFNIGSTLLQSKQQQDLIKQQANAQAQGLDKQLAIEQERTRQAQLGLQNASSGALVGAGGNTMLYVGLGIGAVVILGVVIFAVTRKKAE